MQKGRTGRVTIYEWRSPQEYSNCDLLIQQTSAIVVHGIWKNDIPRTSRTTARVTNILKALAITINMK